MTPGRLSTHAIERATLMGLTLDEVTAVLEDPELDRPGDHGRRIAVGGRLAIPYTVTRGGTRIAVTVLWRDRNGSHARLEDALAALRAAWDDGATVATIAAAAPAVALAIDHVLAATTPVDATA